MTATQVKTLASESNTGENTSQWQRRRRGEINQLERPVSLKPQVSETPLSFRNNSIIRLRGCNCHQWVVKKPCNSCILLKFTLKKATSRAQYLSRRWNEAIERNNLSSEILRHSPSLKNCLKIYLKLCELVVPPDMGVVGGERHEEVDQGEHHQEAGDRRDDKHHLQMLNFFHISFYIL